MVRGKREMGGRERLCTAAQHGVYLYLDRRIFSVNNDMSDLNAFMRAAPRNAAGMYMLLVCIYTHSADVFADAC